MPAQRASGNPVGSPDGCRLRRRVVQADLGEEVCRMVKHKFSHTHRERSSFLILEGLPDSLPAYLAALNQRACAFPAPEATVSLGAALTFISTKVALELHLVYTNKAAEVPASCHRACAWLPGSAHTCRGTSLCGTEL